MGFWSLFGRRDKGGNCPGEEILDLKAEYYRGVRYRQEKISREVLEQESVYATSVKRREKDFSKTLRGLSGKLKQAAFEGKTTYMVLLTQEPYLPGEYEMYQRVLGEFADKHGMTYKEDRIKLATEAVFKYYASEWKLIWSVECTPQIA